MLRAVGLRSDVETARRFADQTKFRWIFQSHFLGNGLASGGIRQVSVCRRLIGRTVDNAVRGAALVWSHAPAIGCSGNQHCPRPRAELAILRKRIPDAERSADDLH